MKKRSCRRTEDEKAIHDRACRVRKMTDAQLCTHLDELATAAGQPPEEVIEDFLQALTVRTTDGTRVSDATIRKLRAIAVDKGFLKGGA